MPDNFNPQNILQQLNLSPEKLLQLRKSVESQSFMMDKLRDSLQSDVVAASVNVCNPTIKTNELLEAQNDKIDELQTALLAANAQIATLHDTVKENEATYQAEQRKASVAAKRTNRIGVAISVIAIIVALLSVVFAEELVELKHEFYNVTNSWRPNEKEAE